MLFTAVGVIKKSMAIVVLRFMHLVRERAIDGLPPEDVAPSCLVFYFSTVCVHCVMAAWRYPENPREDTFRRSWHMALLIRTFRQVCKSVSWALMVTEGAKVFFYPVVYAKSALTGGQRYYEVWSHADWLFSGFRGRGSVSNSWLSVQKLIEISTSPNSQTKRIFVYRKTTLRTERPSKTENTTRTPRSTCFRTASIQKSIRKVGGYTTGNRYAKR